ncbi:kinase-interacting family protein [Ipomoea triloba]|uniref:kinase-interacting family protein n=1 Tax=Ipomoea triloba TaxID=35885 RepID=UPI00125D21BD|nr:kinase-interacting family protein [Ipomoea triloba]
MCTTAAATPQGTVWSAGMDTKMREGQKGCGGEEATVVPYSSNHSRRGSFGKPSWLLCSVADLDERMKVLGMNLPEEGNADDSFAKRADGYYQQRPQLLALLQDLYNGYLSLADRYCQGLAKTHHYHRYSSPIPSLHFTDNEDVVDQEDNGDGGVDSSDVESSLSFQAQFPPQLGNQAKVDPDMIIADLVVRTVECEIILHELAQVERRSSESSRKMELQRSLVEVLESERLILLNENARLGYQVSALVEENKGLASESLFMKRKAADLARCLLKMREDHRVFMLSRKIEDLQGQVHGLEKRNREYYEQLVKHEEEKRNKMKVKSLGSFKGCFQVHGDVTSWVNNNGSSSSTSIPTVKKIGQQGNGGGSKLWGRVKKFDIFLCGPYFNPTNC